MKIYPIFATYIINNSKLKVIIDNAIPFVKGLFEPFAEVDYVKGDSFTADVVKDADALIIRTRTLCNEALLKGSKVRHIASATIGYDHIDIEYCHNHNIEVSTAAGCNARGVLQWMGAALAHLSKTQGWQPQQKTIGLIGVGNVGRLIEEYAHMWGFKVLRCDPPRAQHENGFIEMEELFGRADIVSFHTPLNQTTRHLLNSENIKLMKPDAIIINTSRGEVIESEALLKSATHPIMIDVWEGEPHINHELLRRAMISTPHIAGYSLQGKANGSAMAVRSVARHLSIPLEEWYPEVAQNLGREISWGQMCRTVSQYFDIERESVTLKCEAEKFEYIRNNYNHRIEYF